MKKMYWRPRYMSVRVLILLAAAVTASVAAVESFLTQTRQPFYKEKLAAARQTREAFEALRAERLARKIPIDAEVDPMDSGLIGRLISPVTTNSGQLAAKQTSINPNFAAVIVELLRKARLRPDDTIAVGLSGSFPALNIATLCAIEAMKLRPVIISSAGSSQWGSNIPDFMWPDMEQILNRRGLIHHRSVAISLGGIDDRGLGLSTRGVAIIKDVIAKSGAEAVLPNSYVESVSKRMTIYRDKAAGEEIRAYINVGGGTASVGTRAGKDLFKAGLNRHIPRGGPHSDSVMLRFAQQGDPVINITQIRDLATRYGLPQQPTTIPRVGEGLIFVRAGYNLWIAIPALIFCLSLLVAFLRLDLGYRLFTSSGKPKSGAESSPEPMI
jgi:poly-gamma-glutamate system protein